MKMNIVKTKEANIVKMKEANIVQMKEMNIVKMKEANIQNLPLGFENRRYSSAKISVEVEQEETQQLKNMNSQIRQASVDLLHNYR
ncbi:hypothetical protein WR25_24372 [Diploscapter pachys]|uniref:Uncharacterized protein n=1 Tax=Diploscapter pachys TaxID=2018661 RepID=A0A2A2LRP4_9BILA|nr:hypothetical protein WR25_24372 [Diploscapter pachys]